MNIVRSIKCLSLVMVLFSATADAELRIAVLDFELNDITSLPNTPAEITRTSGMAPLLIEALSRSGAYQIAFVDAATQKSANASFGYLFRFHDLAADLGRQQGADWVLVSQHSKPSFLFSYLWVYLIDVKKRAAVARYDIELKGNHQKVTRHGIDTLAEKIQATLAAHSAK
ncbi:MULTISPECIES: DUF2380 domain-containing protein [Methylomonas]|uniref:DUF2380 domain-containing protein n=2 Tax=Methylomonas TaxID=416 RepID=A0A126T7D7_9GAMM|nr:MULTISPECIES: DUF2380 domain-containing protein [Methylomonas]AMK77986.1 hypothetical protein JT25_016115 [Methylomonas denitrificans]OAI07712.1 hypothetical protein A1342_10525 [Methylomonas methanica]TCV85522.1 uncharacterized protein DUF2380 [Methylomonas methanica]